MFNQLHQYKESKQVQSLAAMSYWSAIETFGNDRTPNSICGVRS